MNQQRGQLGRLIAFVLLLVFGVGQLVLARGGERKAADTRSVLFADYAPWPLVFNPAVNSTQIIAALQIDEPPDPLTQTRPPQAEAVWPTTTPAPPTALRPSATPTPAPSHTLTATPPQELSPSVTPTLVAATLTPLPTLTPTHTAIPSRTITRTPWPSATFTLMPTSTSAQWPTETPVTPPAPTTPTPAPPL